MRTLENFSIEEITFCLDRYEQYWILLNEKIKKRKLNSKRASRMTDILCHWEDQIYIITGIDPNELF